MTYRRRVRNGVIVLDEPGRLPEGTEMEVQPVAQPGPAVTLYDLLKDVIGIADGLPPDMAENHDHYIHGTPRRT